MSGARRSGLVLAAVVVVLVLVGGVVAALTLGGSDDEEAGGGTPTRSTTTSEDDGSEEPEPEETDTSAPPEGIEPFAPTSGLEMSDVCDREATVEGADAFPTGARQLSDLRAFTFVQQPYLDPPLRGRPEWKVARTPTEAFTGEVPSAGGTVNAVVCLFSVDDTAQVRETCVGTGQYAGSTWEVWSSDYFFRTIDPSTGAIVDESEPFSSADLPDPLADACAEPYPDLGGLSPDLREDDVGGDVIGSVIEDYYATLLAG